MEELITNKYLSITEREIKDLKPYINNPRKNDDAVATVEKSIKEFGFINPIVLDKDDSIIVGHTRLKAAIKLGYTKVPTITATDLSPAQVKAFRIMDNKSGEKAEWDWSLLKEELYSLEGTDSFDATGLDSDEITEVWEMEEDTGEVQEDNFQEPKVAKYSVKLGDVFVLGQHRLICGDATDFAMVKTLVTEETVDMVFTDPPYGMFLNADFSGMINNLSGLQGGKKYNNVIGDHGDFNPDFINIIFKRFGYCKEIFLWGADYYSDLLINKNKGSWIVWDKRANNKDDLIADESSDKMYGSCFELCWSKNKHKRDIARIKWAAVFGTEKEFDHKRHHPTQKPILLSNWFISKYSKPNQIVLDLFGGSGSTLIACEQTNRKCRMMELDEHYCSVIIERWEKVTGQKAKKLSGGFPELK